MFSVAGDSGYPLTPFLLTPFPNPGNRGEERYNRSHTRTRSVVEQTFGMLKSRFRCLHQSGGTLQYEPRKCSKIAAACMLLHNRCINRRLPVPEVLEEELEEEDNVHHADVEEDPQPGILANGQHKRNEIVTNFFL